jgi:long-subunit fatty acid transport protein
MVSVAPSLVYSRDNWSLGITAEYIHSQYSLEYTTCGVFKCNQISVLDETSGWSGAISGTLQVNSQLSLAGAYKFATEFGDQNIDIQLPSVASLFATYHANPNLNIHLSYSYSEWKNKGVRYADYDDPIGLLVGANDSHRLATSLEYHLGCAMMMLGMSADQAIDAFGGNDIRLRAGLGYNFGDHWRIDGVVVSENYAEKVGEASGITFVSVQNEGMLLGLGVNYQF